MNIVIVGAGKLGKTLAYTLLRGNHSVTVIDKNDKKLEKLSLQMDIQTVNANGKEVAVLKDLNIAACDYLIAVTSFDEVNMTIAAFAKKLGCKHVIARVREPEHMGQLDFIKDTMKIDYLVNPDLAISNEIYKFLVEKHSLNNGIFSSAGISMIEFSAKMIPNLIGLPLHQTNNIFPNMLVVAISRKGKIIIPSGDDIITDADSLYVIGKREPIGELNEKVHEEGRYNNLQKVMIIGGGKTGLFLAQKLSKFGISVKIIERKLDRCYYLADRLENVMILHGDGTDRQLLEDESIQDMDGFVTATGFDEDNLLLALMAKEYNIDEVVAKVSRSIYAPLVSKLGVDMAVNPIDIVTSNIAKTIQGRKKFITNQLVQGQAEITEFVASSNMKIANRPLKNINIPKGVIIGAIHRGHEEIIPDGNTVIRDGDRVVIFSLLTAVPEMAIFIRE